MIEVEDGMGFAGRAPEPGERRQRSRNAGQAQAPMSDHIARFWKLLATERVRILVDCYHPGAGGHWNSSSFPDDVAKALVAERERAVEQAINALEWINRRGGCGLEVHAVVDAALAKLRPALKGTIDK